METDSFIAVEEARERMLSRVPTTETERLSLGDARGRQIAQPVEAPEDAPPFDNSSRDGFAVRWDDLDEPGARLKLVSRAVAGSSADRPVGAGEAARIATGAPLPEGADTVVMQEHCTVEDESVRVDELPDPGRGAWIRRAGAHMSRGERLLEPGDRVGAAEVGLLASFRETRLDVYRRPTVAVVSTGDELVDIDESPADDQIVNSNAHLLEALCAEAGVPATVLPIAPDEREATRSRFRAALRSADLVVSSGGVSVGDRDEVRGVVDELTGGMDFWKVRMKPGKPLAFGIAGDDPGVPLVGLPGNPNSCFVGFHQFVAPCLQAMQGRSADELRVPRRVEARIDRSVSSTPRRRHYLAGRLESAGDSTPRFVPAANQSSGNVGLYVRQDSFGLVPEGREELEAGASLEVEPLSLLW